MTFSDTRVRDLLNRRFACAWINTEGDPNAGASFAHAPGDPAGTCIRGNGEHNIQLLVLTPAGKIFHVLSGFIAAKELVEELEFALSTFASLSDRGRTAPEQRVAGAHRDFVDVLKKREFKGPLGDWERRRALADHRFVIRHPLLDVGSFRPAMLVGNARTFFGSSRNGKPKDFIGDEEALERVKIRVRKLDEDPDKR